MQCVASWRNATLGKLTGQAHQVATRQFEFDVALSFAGEDRPYVEAVAKQLQRAGVKVFYDAAEIDNLWGKDLFSHLDEVYRKKARYCVMFISAQYKEKTWTNHERKSAQARALEEKQEYILPARFDDTEIPGLSSTISYINLKKLEPKEFSKLIIKKIGGKKFINDPGSTMDYLQEENEISLTPRETECLKWCARGKSSWVISEILNVSERTVNFHIKSAMAKLNVVSRTHAVAKSIALGLIEI